MQNEATWESPAIIISYGEQVSIYSTPIHTVSLPCIVDEGCMYFTVGIYLTFWGSNVSSYLVKD